MKELLRQLKPNPEKGQSLVELAITAPILVFMLLGVFEVGWALRGYLVLTNVNREITRFAIREGYLNYSVKDNDPVTSVTTVGYDKVMSYSYTTLSDQLPLNFSSEKTSTLIISHIVVDTGLACEPGENCDCTRFTSDPNYYLNGTNVLTYDDLILHPGLPGYEHFYAASFPPTLPVTSPYRTKLNYPEVAADLARQNNKFNCELQKKAAGTIPASNNVIVTEIYYNQPQLFGFPVIANPYTNPVPMYAHTTMRMIVASRTGENVNNVGPVCIAHPFTLKSTRVATATAGSILDILGGESPAGTDDRGFLGWDPQWDNATDLNGELLYPRTSFNSYRNAQTGSTDTSLSVGDWVASLSGNTAGVDPQVESLVGKVIIIPVFDNFCTGNTQCPTTTTAAFHISTFIKVQIIDSAPYEINLSSSNGGPNVYATYVGPATECLQ